MKIVRFFALSLVACVALSGCATTRARKSAEPAQSAQVEELQKEIETRDRQIADLQYQLDSYQQALTPDSKVSGGSSGSYIRVSGVTVKDVQRALARAGFDPGPVDGRFGRKTKAAIKAFQRRSNLKADGIVGEKTWAKLK